jgi:predicted transcriptional regulator
MDEEKVRIIDYPKNEENPFIHELLSIKRKNKIVAVARNKSVVDRLTGEATDAVFMGIQREVDKEDFVKIFTSGMKELFDLSKNTLKVFSYLLSITSFDDKIFFELNHCKKYTGYTSRETIFKAIRELLQNGIIAKSLHPNMYFINPNYFYKGDRLVMIREYRVKKDSKAIPEEIYKPLPEEKIKQQSLFESNGEI